MCRLLQNALSHLCTARSVRLLNGTVIASILLLGAGSAAGQDHLWSMGFDGPSDDEGRAVAIDASGNVIVTGEFNGTVDFGGGPMVSSGYLDIKSASGDIYFVADGISASSYDVYGFTFDIAKQ